MNAPRAEVPAWSSNALEGLRLVVAGGCGGIGRELVAQALGLGARVAVLDLAASIAAHPRPGLPQFAMDARDAASVEQAVALAAAALGGVDACVNLVGFMTPPFGMLVFTVKAALPEENVSTTELFAGTIPYMASLLVVIAIIYVFPATATYLLTVGR